MTHPDASMGAMTDGLDLFAATREHDLPPKWDGAATSWGDWDEMGTVLCSKVKREPCDRCGSTTQPRVAVGFTIPTRSGPVVHLHERRLHAFRCPGCLHDTVWDMSTGEWWDLDPTDYDDEGSNPPPEAGTR